MASKTAHDAAQMLLNSPSELPVHPLEHLCLPPAGTFPDLMVDNHDHFLQLLDVYVNNFIGLLQAPSLAQALHFTCVILHGIHKVFPPAHITGHQDDKPIALKKLHQGNGTWSTSKEILGWIFDGINHVISLPSTKVKSLLSNLCSFAQKHATPVRQLE